MKKISILVGEKSPSGERFAESMQDYSNDSYSLRRYSDIVVRIKDSQVSCFYLDDKSNVADADLVYLRGITYEPLRHVLAAYLRSKRVAVVNSESHKFQAMSKLEQYVVLALAGVPVPDSIFVSKPEYYTQVPQLLESTFPFVAKSITGSNGRDNVLVSKEDELDMLDVPMPIFQTFIPNEFDYRVIVAGNKVALAYKRVRSIAAGDYKNNIAQGGQRVMAELSSDLQDMAIKSAHAVGREFAGLDIVTNSQTGESCVLEVNFNFGAPVFEDTELEHQYYTTLSTYFHGLAS